MNIYGERYAPVGDFIGYCRDLNIETTERELEHYERTGVMLPVARVIYPDEYVVRRDDRLYEGVVNRDEIENWPALLRLEENIGPFPHRYKNLSDKELIHRFDRELESDKKPSYLLRPNSGEFRPWDEYRVPVTDKRGNEFKRSTVEHYYAYWQVYQIYAVQRYPALFQGWSSSFDALSFWITVFIRERNRTFASVPETNGVRVLDDDQNCAHLDRLVKHARMVKERFNLDIGNIHEFLRWLVDTFHDYERRERYKLSLELKKDIFHLEDFYRLLTGKKTRDEVVDAVWGNDIYGRRAFRHLILESKERDYAFSVIKRISDRKTWNRAGSSWSFSESDINALLDYCEHEGLGLLSTALSGMMAIGDEEYRQNFRRVRMYTNLKTVLNSYEYLVKSLAEKNVLGAGNGKTLTPLVGSIVSEEDWAEIFNGHVQKGSLSANSEEEFLDKLYMLLDDQTLNESANGFWAQAFLITCLARNGTVHLYPTDDRYYGDLFSPMLDAVVHAMFYTWKLAQANRAAQETGDE